MTHFNTHFFTPYKSCELRKAKLKINVVEGKNGLSVELSADKPVFFVNFETPGIKGIFSDNCVTVLPGRKETLAFDTKQKVTKAQL